MKLYEKPMILSSSTTSEGVYMASGTDGGSGKVSCDSKYLKGQFNAGDWSIPSNSPQYTNLNVRGCEGCPANWGGSCALQNDSYNPSQAEANVGNFMPSWEKQGKSPDGNPNQ